MHPPGFYHLRGTSWRSALPPRSARGENCPQAALPEGFSSVKQYKCVSPQLTISENSSAQSLEGVRPFACGFAVIVLNELSPESFRISSERLCPNGLAGKRAVSLGMVQ